MHTNGPLLCVRNSQLLQRCNTPSANVYRNENSMGLHHAGCPPTVSSGGNNAYKNNVSCFFLSRPEYTINKYYHTVLILDVYLTKMILSSPLKPLGYRIFARHTKSLLDGGDLGHFYYFKTEYWRTAICLELTCTCLICQPKDRAILFSVEL